MTTAVYPGTFDPITNGHTDLVRRAAKLLEKVIVGVVAKPAKVTVFSKQQRVAMAREVMAEIHNVEVCSFATLLVEFVTARNATIIVRGLRAVSDFEYEFQLASMNRRLAPGIETLFLTPAEEYAFVSASMVREIASLGGDVSSF